MQDMERRTFLEGAIFPLIALGQSSAPQGSPRVVRVEHGVDRFNKQRTIAGANQITYKVSGQDTKGGLFLFEQTSLRKGGPPRHLHHSQEEWFYVMEGEYVFEVGQERMRVRPADSLLAPRKLPHVLGVRPAWREQGRDHWLSTRADVPIHHHRRGSRARVGKTAWRPSFKRRQRSRTSRPTRSCSPRLRETEVEVVGPAALSRVVDRSPRREATREATRSRMAFHEDLQSKPSPISYQQLRRPPSPSSRLTPTARHGALIVGCFWRAHPLGVVRGPGPSAARREKRCAGGRHRSKLTASCSRLTRCFGASCRSRPAASTSVTSARTRRPPVWKDYSRAIQGRPNVPSGWLTCA